MSINIKVRYRALMTHGLSYDIESRTFTPIALTALGLIEDAPSCPPFSFLFEAFARGNIARRAGLVFYLYEIPYFDSPFFTKKIAKCTI